MVAPNEIQHAVRRGDTAAIQEWFSSGTRDLDESGAMLYMAAFHGHCETMRFLLDHGASVNFTTSNGQTPLSAAAHTGRYDAAVLLLDRGALIDLANVYGCTPLIWAAWHDHCDMIRLLLSRGAALDARKKDGLDAEAQARFYNKDEAAALLADIRHAGDWHAYLRYPRKRLLALRVLCERGRASTDDGLLERVFGPNVFVPQGIDPVVFKKLPEDARAAVYTASRVAYPSQPEKPRSVARAQLPKEVFWLILEFWRSDRDARASSKTKISTARPRR